MVRFEELQLIIGMMLVTYLVRYPALAIVGRVKLPDQVVRALNFVPVAVLSAIIAPELLFRDGSLGLAPNNAYLAAGLVAMLVAWRWGNLLLTLAAGMGSFFLWRALIAG